MINELKGYISEITNSTNGFIMGNNNIEYFFSVIDFIENFTFQLGTPVVFKPVTLNNNLHKAILISKDEEK